MTRLVLLDAGPLDCSLVQPVFLKQRHVTPGYEPNLHRGIVFICRR